ncbi:MAG: two-component system sensor histidine kinase NtrB [Chloroflexota bacterium]
MSEGDSRQRLNQAGQAGAAQPDLAPEQDKQRLADLVRRRALEFRERQRDPSEAFELSRKIVQACPVGITAYEASGRCILANESAARIVGATRGQILDQNFREIASWRDGRLLEAAQTALQEGRATRKEAHVVSTFGKELWLDCRFIPFSLCQELHLLVITEDVTEPRRLQEQVVRQERLATLGRLSGNVGHELRNPLGAIQNAAYFLQLALENPDPDVQEAIDILVREVGRSEAVIRALLESTRSRSPTWREVDLRRILQQVLEDLNAPPEIELVARLDEQIPAIRADAGQLGQVFLNIARNAVQAMPGGGRLLLEARVPRSGSADPRSVAISISDTGPGVPELQQDVIFEPLFTTRTHGIGLGLAITRELVEAHGGTIDLISPSNRAFDDGGGERVTAVAGAGTTFTVHLPIEPQESLV